jgi:hypothetical protein
MLLVDDVGNVGAGEPLQIAVSAVNVGVTDPAVTVCINEVVVAHWPAPGVNTYVPVAVLLTVEGSHVPVIGVASVEAAGNVGAVPPTQIPVSGVNAGIVLGVIVCTKVCVVAQTPAAGVNVYVPVAVLFIVAGFQVPVTPFVDVAGNAVGAVPLQIGAKAVNVGVVLAVTVCTKVWVVAHKPVFGVNV